MDSFLIALEERKHSIGRSNRGLQAKRTLITGAKRLGRVATIAERALKISGAVMTEPGQPQSDSGGTAGETEGMGPHGAHTGSGLWAVSGRIFDYWRF